MPTTAIQNAERRLVRQAQQGDAQAFSRLYDEHVDAIYRYISLRVPSKQHTEDLTEEVFWKAWQAIGKYQPQRPFLHWLYRIAHNLVINDAKRAARHSSYETMTESGQPMQDDGPPPDARVLQQDDVQQVRKALVTLSPAEQTLLSMRFFENASYDEIAAVLDKKPGALRVMQHRALKKLATQLAPMREAA